MYRLTIPKDKFGDLIILLLFDKIFDEEFMNNNERFNTVFDKMRDKGLRSILFQEYFNIDSQIKSKYKRFRKNLEDDNTDVSMFLFYMDQVDESEDFYREIIKESVKRLTKKENPDPDKLEQFTDEVLNSILKENSNGR